MQSHLQKLNLDGIAAVIFDLNGTIINDGAYHDRAFDEFFKRYNLPLTSADYRQRFYARKNEEFMAELMGKPLTPEEAMALSVEKEEIYHALYGPDIKEVAGFTALADRLKKAGLKLGLATSSPPTNLEFAFAHLPIEHFFDAIVHSGEVKKSKPDPEIYLKTAEKLQVAPQACLVFEDAPVGVQSAQSAGMHVITMLTSHKSEELATELQIQDFTEFSI